MQVSRKANRTFPHSTSVRTNNSTTARLGWTYSYIIGGFRGGGRGGRSPPSSPFFSKHFCTTPPHSNRPGNRFIKCSLILFFSETLMFLYFAPRIRPQCCMLHVLKSEVHSGGGGGGRRQGVGDSAPSF